MGAQQFNDVSSVEIKEDLGTVQLVTFEINQELFGIEVSHVQEVIKFNTITPAPGAMKTVEGVIDLRGDIIPVIDLHKRFNMEPPREERGSKILITEVREYIFGFIVDKVDEVCTFPLAEFSPPPPGITRPGSDFTVGVGHQGERLLLYLDIEKVLDIDQLLQEYS